ncbi:MAG: iron-containing alcohol dehydrogenase [Acidimicrobiia bacterium]|nr:iron-containing alcohol dehydrogenase [Acidimicrobiia bacterium]
MTQRSSTGDRDPIDTFAFQMPTRIVWGTPVIDAVPAEVAALGVDRVLIVTDPGLATTGLPDAVRAALEHAGVAVAVHADVSGNPTTDDVAAARSIAESSRSGAIVAIGGGSAIDTAKASAMLLANGGEYADYQWDGRPITRRSHPFVAVPTTAGTGSEVTKVAVISDASQPFKKGVLSPLMFAHVAILDPEVTIALPPHLTAATGIDALVHAFEAYTGRRTNPISDLLALESLRLAIAGLGPATADGSDLDARGNMMLAALYGGMAMDQSGLGLVHALSGGICSHLHLHHGLANAMILPYALEFNVSAIRPERLRRLADVLGLPVDAGGEHVVDMLTELVRSLDLPIGLGTTVDADTDVDWDDVAAESMRMVMVHNNPRTVTVEDCRAILEAMLSSAVGGRE